MRACPRRTHIAIVSASIEAALRCGRKTIESRFARARRAPIGCVAAGDLLYFKRSGGPLIGRTRVLQVHNLNDVTPVQLHAIRRDHAARIAADAGFWRRQAGRRYGVLIWIDKLQPVNRSTITVARQFGTAWLTLPNPMRAKPKSRAQIAGS